VTPVIDPVVAIDRLRAAFRGPRKHRALHAKGRFYRGFFVATPEAAALCRAGHLSGVPTPVVVRWSNAGGNADVPDPKPDIRGMAVRFQLADGTSTDLLGQTSPRFPTDVPEQFVALTQASLKSTFPLYLLTHPKMLPAIAAGARARAASSHASFAEAAYHPIHAYGWLDAAGTRTWVRYIFRPVATESERLDETFSGADRLAGELAARLARGPVTHALWVQIAGRGHDPPSAVSVWKGCRELLAGHVVVTEELPDPEAGGAPTVFDPTRVVDGIELSDDPILRFRQSAYAESFSRRV
jgi:catalase